jgi:NAD(P)-dependent dehydrogenase (short-subunit alcohol dehydrogenase family)
MKKAFAIFGGAGGLGSAVTRRLGTGASLTIGYHKGIEKAEKLCQELRDNGHAVSIDQVDICNSASVKSFLDKAKAHWGRLDGIVSVTGPAIPLCPLSEVSEADFRRIMETDVMGSFNILQNGIAAMKTSGGGSIVLFVTTAVLRTLDNDGMSGIPKTAVAGLLRQAAREAGQFNIRCNGVAPGVINAGIVLDSFQVSDVAKGVIEDCMRQTPMGRMGTATEVAALVDFLVSDDAAYVNGQIIAVDGGYSA